MTVTVQEPSRLRSVESSGLGLRTQKLETVGLLTLGVTHDFRNILTAMNAMVRLLDRDTADPARRHYVLDEVSKCIQRGQALTQLLRFSRESEPQTVPVDVAALIAGLDAVIASTVGGGIVVHTDIEAGLPAIMADPSHIELALLNLIANARDAMPDGGSLFLTAGCVRRPSICEERRVKACVKLSVCDTGEGMDVDTMEHARELFFTTKPAGEGTGLGLWLVHRLITELGGGVSLSSVKGSGTSVDLWLPIA